MSTTLHLKLSDADTAALEFLAKHYDRAKNYLGVKAIKHYIAEMMDDLQDEMDADMILERANNPNMRLYSSEEVLKFIEEHCKD